MVKYILRTKDRQGEYLKPKYDGSTPKEYNHYIHSNKAKVLEYATKNNISGFIDRVKI